ncbi:acetyltransferase [Gammaproteobacteria bacterium]|nr:acetyltransferase [Gammaproteobacteria bacterium]
MTKLNIFIGGGGHASVLFECLMPEEKQVSYIVDPKLKNSFVELINDIKFSEYDSDQINLINGIGFLPASQLRKEIFTKYKDLGYTFKTIKSDKSIISPSATILEGAQILQGSVIQSNSVISENVIINTNCSVDHNSFIGESSHICPGVTICGNVSIGKNVFIGAGSVIINGIRIKDASIVPAGSTIKRDI